VAFVWLQFGVLAACLAVAVIVVIPAAALAGIGQETPGHYRHLDGVRGLAAMAVVACHINQHVLDLIGDTRSPALGNHLGTLAVHMFFALTSFLLVRKALDGRLDPFPFYRSRMPGMRWAAPGQRRVQAASSALDRQVTASDGP
jgi:hypothetical protein